MIQLQVLSGKTAGAQVVVRRFPFRMGRGESNDMILSEPGIWDRHIEIFPRASEGFVIAVAADALAFVNGKQFKETTLRNGDLIEAGAVKMRFSLSPVRQRSFFTREVFTWIACCGLFVLQILIILWLAGSL